jgi:hypothetical protein
MTETLKVLGQAAPGAAVSADLYTVPGSTQTVVSSLTIANRAGTATTFRVAVRPSGVAIANQHYLAYDAALAANGSIAMSLGLSLGAGDVLTVQAASSSVSFGAFGQESG